MNRFDENSGALDILLIDRLIAGELSDSERRDVLLKLEAEPDGWRRCALAFLEDQSWRSAIGGSASLASKVIPLKSSTMAAKPRWLGRLVYAASIIGIAFSAGFGIGGRHQVKPQVQVTKEMPGTAFQIPGLPDRDEIREEGWIDLVDAAQGELPPQRVPIVSGPGLDEQWLRDHAPAVPEYVRALWERRGYHVQERRNLVSVTLADGRRVSIPVDEVAVDYVGQQPL